MRWRSLIVVQVMLFSAGVAASRAESKTEPKLADCFNVRWSSIQFNRSVVLRNPAQTPGGSQPTSSESLTLSCEVEVRDPNRVLGISREATIRGMTGGAGREINAESPPSRRPQYYEGLRYRPRMLPPSQPPRWKRVMRSLLRMAPKRTSPQLVTELQPSTLVMEFDPVLLAQGDGEITHIEGYFHALVAESLEYIEVPFEPNDCWVRLTPELEIRVREAQCGQSRYEYHIETRNGDVGGRPFLRVGEPMPGRLVFCRQLMDADGKRAGHFGPMGRLPGHIGGRGSGSGPNVQIEAIRFVIAVRPTHRKVPFALEHIPLPDPTPPAVAPQDSR